jgi:hypothetical protein
MVTTRNKKSSAADDNNSGDESSLGSEFEYSDAEEQRRNNSSTPSSSRRKQAEFASPSSVTSTGSKRGLPEHIDKQLITDIEESGGIDNFDAGVPQATSQIILNNPERENIYGKRGDPIRHKLTQRVKYLKTLPREKYAKVLEKVFGDNPPKQGKTSKTIHKIERQRRVSKRASKETPKETPKQSQTPKPTKASRAKTIKTSTATENDSLSSKDSIAGTLVEFRNHSTPFDNNKLTSKAKDKTMTSTKIHTSKC